jgi:hypothetical protein
MNENQNKAIKCKSDMSCMRLLGHEFPHVYNTKLTLSVKVDARSLSADHRT